MRIVMISNNPPHVCHDKDRQHVEREPKKHATGRFPFWDRSGSDANARRKCHALNVPTKPAAWIRDGFGCPRTPWRNIEPPGAACAGSLDPTDLEPLRTPSYWCVRASDYLEARAKEACRRPASVLGPLRHPWKRTMQHVVLLLR